jgi:hypothetical protein
MWILLEQVTTITSVQILAMGSTPVEIIPAPPAGQINVPVQLAWDVKPGGVNYSGTGSLTTAFAGGATAFTTFAPGLNASVQNNGVSLAAAEAAAAITTRAGNITASLAAPLTLGNGTLRITAKYYTQALQ